MTELVVNFHIWAYANPFKYTHCISFFSFVCLFVCLNVYVNLLFLNTLDVCYIYICNCKKKRYKFFINIFISLLSRHLLAKKNGEIFQFIQQSNLTDSYFLFSLFFRCFKDKNNKKKMDKCVEYDLDTSGGVMEVNH